MPEPDLVNISAAGSSDEVVAPPRDARLRYAVARATVEMAAATAAKIESNEIAKGDVLGCARIAGIQAAKRASDLIPTALPVMVGGVTLSFTVHETSIAIEARVEAFDRLGVSMEALTSASVAALTIYDMCKAIDRSMIVTDVVIEEQSDDDGSTWRRGPS